MYKANCYNNFIHTDETGSMLVPGKLKSLEYLSISVKNESP